ncbi:hypothetical protein MPS_2948 [Mycobacterium pseudoshottsii JCM 15466]|nr:hypothetical protein MMSP_3735 [Mycobacterium sp. 012931]EPQ76214.1 hypothetical protein MMMB2_0874 [Mycobacterium marinum MB2]MBC9863191.1 hypothetical protein [Mycobacterium pseudoshottsii]GAQ36008.1 hypothetical protein MPS_2948 [Mycobacterium pseudoshottsii JCM 15466]
MPRGPSWLCNAALLVARSAPLSSIVIANDVFISTDARGLATRLRRWYRCR